MRGLITRCSVNSDSGSSSREPRTWCSSRCWRCVGSRAGSRPGANSAPTRRMCWPLCARSAVWKAWAKRCAPRSTRWPRSSRSGCWSTSRTTGLIATCTALNWRASPQRRASRSSCGGRSVRMGSGSCRPPSSCRPPRQCAPYRRCSSCGRCGSSITKRSTARCAGAMARR